MIREFSPHWQSWMLSIGLLWLGLYLSAFFSGTETGFYRISRIRLLLDARAGQRIAQRLLWLVSRPAHFVATTLVGNNVANYLTTMAMVLLARQLLSDWEHPELVGTLLLTPLVFVYGELIPKSLYYQAPRRFLLRRTGLLCVFAAAFAPLSWPLAGLTAMLAKLAGQIPEPISMLLGRRRLEQLFQEGHEEGLLTPSQRHLVQGLFSVATRPVSERIIPLSRVVAVREQTPVREVLRLARRLRLPLILVRGADSPASWKGYVSASELAIENGPLDEHIHPLVKVPASDTNLQALIRLHQQGGQLGLVMTAEDKPLGIVSARELSEGLFRSS